jgi:exosortase A-associated hydrolase 2
MTLRQAPPLEPVFLDGPAGRLFAVYHAPAPGTAAGSAVLYIPPFAEEMNRSRRMAALQARALAAAGFGALLLDLYGTGDSAGEFRDARWATWLGDVRAASTWLERRLDRPVQLLGLRLGGLLAVSAAAAEPERFRRLILWQPVVDGRTMLTQFLRVRIAASLTESTSRETTEALRAELSAGRTLEVAGYEVAAELGAALDAVRLDRLVPPKVAVIDWLDVTATSDAELPPARRQMAEGWRTAGATVSIVGVAGEPFWTTQEVTLAPDLLAATLRVLATCPT